MMSTRRSSTFAGLAAAALVAGSAGCDDSATGPIVPGGTTQFSQQITLPELQDRLNAGAARVEIKLLPGGLVAREVEIENPAEMADEEEIESRITAIADATGTVTLALGGLQVTYTDATRFRDENGGDDLTRAEFVARVQAELGAGRTPPVEAKRDPPAEPQAPGDLTFVAGELRLDDEADEPEIEINVDADNVVLNDAPPPDAWLAVLGIQIELRVGAGITQLEAAIPAVGARAEFEGMAQSVDLDVGTVTLAGGTVIRIVVGTQIEPADDDDELESLSAVQAALEAGLFVEVDGKGVAEATEPLTFAAIEVEFEVEDDAANVPGVFEFQGAVTTADPAAGTLTLAGGTVVRVNAETQMDPEGDLFTLESVRAAVDAGAAVRAEGDATVESMGPPAMLVALSVKWEVDD